MQRVYGHCSKCEKTVPCLLTTAGMAGANILTPSHCPQCQTEPTVPQVQFALQTEIERHGGKVY